MCAVEYSMSQSDPQSPTLNEFGGHIFLQLWWQTFHIIMLIYLYSIGIVEESPSLLPKTGELILETLDFLIAERFLILASGYGKEAILPSLRLISSIFEYCELT